MPRGIRRWSSAKCLAAAGLSLGLVAGFVGATAAAVAAQPWAAGDQGGQWGPFHWRPAVKGTVASTSTSPTTGFTLDVAGCSTPQFITTNGSTTYSEPGTGITPTGVVAGENVTVQLVRGASTLTAGQVTILLAQISGTVKTVSASELLVTDQQGFQRTVDLDVGGTTAYFPTGATVVTGDRVNAVGTVDATHADLDAVAVHVRSAPTLPANFPPADLVFGVVTSVTPGTSFVVTEPNGTTQTITTTSTTKYGAIGASSRPTGVLSKERVVVRLVSGAATPTADNVLILLSELDGTVESVGSTSFVLQDSQGFWRTVDLDVGGTTTYVPTGATVATGDHVVAFGTIDADLTDLDAQFVYVLPTPASNWFDAQRWQAVAAGCPVTPQAWPAFGPTEAPHSPASVDPQGTGASAGGWSSGHSSTSATTSSPDSAHGYSGPGTNGFGNGGRGSFPGSPGGPGGTGRQGGGPGGGPIGPGGGPGGR